VTTVATSETVVLPAVPAAAKGQQTHEASAPARPAPASPDAAAHPQAPESPVAPASSAPIGFKLRYDQDTQRLILEARDPVSGFVIYQIPPKYVVKQFTAKVGTIAPARGKQVDSAV
jgi:hypothetical protein